MKSFSLLRRAKFSSLKAEPDRQYEEGRGIWIAAPDCAVQYRLQYETLLTLSLKQIPQNSARRCHPALLIEKQRLS